MKLVLANKTGKEIALDIRFNSNTIILTNNSAEYNYSILADEDVAFVDFDVEMIGVRIKPDKE